ncbi:prominin [Methanobacterium virus Drs3]|uniref:Prominin n=2 Tax=Methanobacterium virus Drs3 TaxID=1430441 RepID=A0A385AHB8_9CAUD|nr:prominin [Methanobacterium virus Drs3]AXN53412.1 prominin [Methanobacterium virus Drs3]
MAALMEIIIRAVDKASEVADKVQGKFSGMGDKVSKSLDKVSQSTEKLSQAYQKMGTNGMSAYAQLTAKQQQHYQSMSKSRAMLEHLASSGTRMGNLIKQGLTTADNAMSKISNTASQLRTKLENTTIGSKLVSGLESASVKVTSFTQKFDGVKAKIAEVGSKIGSAIGNGLDRAKSKVEALNEKLGTMGQVITSAVGAIGMGGIYDLTVGLGMAREQMITLMTATTGSAGAARNLVNQLDQITNRSVVGLSELGNAMNNIKISTGMTTKQLSLIAPTVDKVGQAAILMGKDTTTAQEIMTASFRGLNGEFDILRSNFGITKQTLMDAGWSGAADDVEGYNAALSKVLDENLDLSGVMDSTTGKIEKIKKSFRTAGKIIGEQVVPYIEKAADIFLRLTQQFPGLTTGIIAIAAGFMLFLTALPILGSVFGALKSMAVFLGIVKGAEDALTLSKMKSAAVDAATMAYTRAKAAALAVLGAATRVYNFIVAEGTIATKLATAAQWLWNAALAANPIGIVVVAIIALIAVLAYLYNSNETVRNAINWLWNGLKQLGGYIYGGLIAAWNALSGALGWVWNILVQVGGFIVGTLIGAWNSFANAVSPITQALGLLWNALQQVFGDWFTAKASEANGVMQALGEVFSAIAGAAGGLWNAISQVASVLGEMLAPYVQKVLLGLQLLWSFLGGAFTAVWQTVGGVLEAFISYIATFITLLADLISGNITFTEFMSEMWVAFQQLIGEVIGAILSGIGEFVYKMVDSAIQAVTGWVNAFLSFLPQIPGMIAFYLGFAIGQFISFSMSLLLLIYDLGVQLITWVINTGVSFITNLGAWLMQLPGLVWAWLNQVILSVVNWASVMVSYAISTATNFVRAVIAWISQLPGKVWSFLRSVISRVTSFASTLPGLARQAGSNLVNGLINTITSLPGKVYDVLRQVYNKVASVGGDLYNAAVNLGSQIWNGFKAGLGIHSPSYLEKAMDAIIDRAYEMPDEMRKVKDELANLKWTDANPEIGMPGIAMPDAMLDTDKIAEQASVAVNAANQTNIGVVSAYNDMGNKVTNAISQMVSSDQAGWNKITTNNNSQLNSIKKTTADTTKQMTDAWKRMSESIVSNADKIRSGSSGHITRLSVNIRGFYHKLMNPTSWFAGPRPSRKGSSASFKAAGPGLTPERILDGFRFLESPCTDCYAGGWNYSAPNTKKINNTVNGYPVIMPDIKGLFVRDFLNTDNPLYGNLKLFEAVAERLIGPTSYDFYYNGRYSNLEALQRGAFNCWDGAEILMALGSAMGLPVSMARGKWGNIGHVAAVVGGKIFDTTQRQKRGVWRGSHGVSFGPGPSNKANRGSSDIGGKVELNVNLKHEFDFKNIPNSVTKEELMNTVETCVRNSPRDNQFIRLVSERLKILYGQKRRGAGI